MTTYKVFWSGHTHGGSGIGIAGREYVRALRRQGVQVELRQRAIGGAKSSAKKSAVLIHHGLPHHLNLRQARAKYGAVILNTVWETTRIPRNWFPSINRYDAVCVPSLHNVKALRRSGVKVPIYLVPHGVHGNLAPGLNQKRKLPYPKGTFVFLSVFTFQHRKNPEGLLRAYWKEFSRADKTVLIIKTEGFQRSESGTRLKRKMQAYKNRLKLRKSTAPVYVITDRVSSRTLQGLYKSANAFVLPTRGEGVGMPFQEALASGVPVIATGWGGQMDFVNHGNSFLVNYQLMPPAVKMKGAISKTFRPLFCQGGQLWAEPNNGSLRKQMRKAYSQPLLCKAKGAKGRADMRRYTWNHAGSAMKKAVEAVVRKRRR
ncbi:glycosyltransferase family 4 protein [Paenibacillus gansuensis]|uniref:Glycosyltransferase family 4 protein n=1 Tax=Paenibacillus gansuensis TaxID=306542 RepID=A0ABW5PGY4_9BACL